MNEQFNQLLENNLILESNPKLMEFEIYNKAFNELNKNIKKMMKDYEEKIECDYNEIIKQLKIEQNRIISALYML
jgi:hypothetical protein